MWHNELPVRLLPTPTHCWLCTMLLALSLMWLLTTEPASARAQTGSIVLTVQCHTVAGEPVPGVVVTVFDVASDVMLLRGTTDGNGIARFPQMLPGEMRVQITGTLESGVPLRHTRQDRRGIWVNLPVHDWVMDLRADTDGLVFPDLGLSNAGAPDAEVATAISRNTLATVGPTIAPVVTTMPQAMVQPRVGTPQVTVAAQPSAGRSERPALLLLLVLLGTTGGTIWLLTRSKA